MPEKTFVFSSMLICGACCYLAIVAAVVFIRPPLRGAIFTRASLIILRAIPRLLLLVLRILLVGKLGLLHFRLGSLILLLMRHVV